MTVPPIDVWPPGGDEALLTSYRSGLAVRDGDGVIAAFEEEVRRQGLGATYVLAQSSGTAALHSAYFGAGFGRGDEVIVPTFGFHATVTALLAVGAVPVFVDVEPSGLPSVDAVSDAWSTRTVGAVITHLWGIAHDLTLLADAVAARGGRLIEDCSHSLGARAGGRPAGSWGFAAAASLHASKPIPTSEGGLLTTDDRSCYERALVLGHGGSRAVDEVHSSDLVDATASGLGFKYRMSAPSAALGIASLQASADRARRRSTGVRRFVQALGDLRCIRPAFTDEQIDDCTWYRVPLRLSGRLEGARGPVNDDLLAKGAPVITESLMGAFTRVPLLTGPSVHFPWLPDGWGCTADRAAGATRLQDSTVLLDADALAVDPAEVAAACRRVANG